MLRKFKLTGIHLIMILLGSLILFSVFRPIMEGFDDKGDDKDTDNKPTPQSQMHTMLGALTDKAETLMYGQPYNTTPLGAAATTLGTSTLGAGTSTSTLGAGTSTSTLGAGRSTLGAGTSILGDATSILGDATSALDAGASALGSETSNFLQSISEKTGNLMGNGNNKQASYIGPAGDTVIVDNPRQPMQLPPTQQPQQQQSMGISKSQIPSGSEDMYILKSQVVPPVCPACPNVSACPRPAPYPPCPPCARCPEPSFDCKKVPNYRNGSENTYLPRPVLADFSQFGM